MKRKTVLDSYKLQEKCKKSYSQSKISADKVFSSFFPIIFHASSIKTKKKALNNKENNKGWIL